MHILRYWSRLLVTALLALSLSGCLFHFATSYTSPEAPDGSHSLLIDTEVTVEECAALQTFVWECIFGGPLGFHVTANFNLTGFEGNLLNWMDPIIVQVPAGITVTSGTFSGPANGNISITTVAGPLQADATRQIVPEAGTKFLILDFPGGVPPGGPGRYHYQLNVTAAPGVPSPLSVKVLFAAKVTVAGRTYYPPLLPCTTNMANVPALALPTANMIAPFNPAPFLTQQACSNVNYDLTPSAPGIVTVNEYYHSGFDHYFVTPVPAEQALLDARSPPFQDWASTGKTFKAYANATAPASSVAVCRFFNNHFGGKSSHFYAARGFGCEATLSLFPDWGLEDDKLFNTLLPDISGVCPQGTGPVYRVYNQGMGSAPNHRFVTTLTDQQEMVSKGFVAEGVVMCVPP
jgi:hypothetical protein